MIEHLMLITLFVGTEDIFVGDGKITSFGEGKKKKQKKRERIKREEE